MTVAEAPHLHGPLLRQWLTAIASEQRAVVAAAGQQALATQEVRRIDRRLRDERDWVLDFSWPPGYDPVADDCRLDGLG